MAFYVDIRGDFPDGTITEIDVGPWTTREDAKACLDANKRKLRQEGCKKVVGSIYQSTRTRST